ncbi:unnamed protein product [Clavelina lepadiformis]
MQETDQLSEELQNKQMEIIKLLIIAKQNELELTYEATKPEKDLHLEEMKTACESTRHITGQLKQS